MGLTLNGENGIVYDNLNNDIKNLLMPKNWIINGMFDVWQRSTSQTTSGYGSDDRFNNINFGSTKTHSQQAFTVGQTAVPNNPKYFSRTVVSSVAGVGNYASKAQRIEDVVKLAGKTITFSFWAKADANKNMAIEFVQNFGSGGSASVVGIGVQKFALTSSWQKFTKTITLPSVSGKTIGIDNYLALSFWFDAGSDFNARTDSLGQQSGTFDIANVSLVEGSVAVECQNEPYDEVLRDCQRYYYRLNGDFLFSGNTNSTTSGYALFTFPIPLRVAPTSLQTSALLVGRTGEATVAIATITFSNASMQSVLLNFTGSGFPIAWSYVTISSASNGFLAFNAEL